MTISADNFALIDRPAVQNSGPSPPKHPSEIQNLFCGGIAQYSGSPQVTVASRTDGDAIVGVITMAFANDPAGRGLYPDPAQYLRFCPEFIRLYGGLAFDHGGAHFTPGYAAASLDGDA